MVQLPRKKKFTKRTIRCPQPGCGLLVGNASGLTQHMQASHSAVRRHRQVSPTPGPADREQTPYDDDQALPGNDNLGRDWSAGPGAAHTIIHPLLDGEGFSSPLRQFYTYSKLYRNSLRRGWK
jgi:hypothetical protein